jgi:glycosyltransferase involved in cell wall biosynthesis
VKPKILHVTQATGGVETSITLLLRHFDRSRFEHHLVCPPETSLETKARELGIRVVPIKMARGPHPVRDITALLALIHLIRKERYEIVHGHSAKGGYLARFAARIVGGRRAFYHPRGFSYLSQTGLARSLFLFLERIAVRWTDVVIGASESETRRAIDEVGFPPSRAVTVFNSIDFSEAEDLHLPPVTVPVVLSVGRFAYQKNPEMFVRVARLVSQAMPTVRFCWLGAGFAGPLEGQIRGAISEGGLGDRFAILPWGTKKEALAAIAGCAVFVLTSRFEALGNATQEAMMLGKPVVVTDVDGSRDLVLPGINGYVVREDDDDAMAVAIIQVLSDPALASKMGNAGRQRAIDMFDIRKNARILEEVYAGRLK